MTISRKHISDRQPGALQAWRDGCRCYPCSGAWSEYRKRQQAEDWKPFVDAQPVRDHLAHLSAHGIGVGRVATLTGVQRTTLHGIRGACGRKRTTRVRTETADRILAIRPDMHTADAGAYIDGTGTYRRLRALAALGFPATHLAHRLGSRYGHLHLLAPSTYVRAGFARAVCRLYDELWLADPAQFGVRPSTITATRRRAEANGWPRPLEWDDDVIDDPAAEAQRVGRVEDDGERTVTPEQLEDLRWILSTVDVDVSTLAGREQVGTRLGIKAQRVEYILAKKLVAA